MLSELRVGRILTSHGLKGEVKVQPTTDDPRRFLELRSVFLRPGQRPARSLSLRRGAGQPAGGAGKAEEGGEEPELLELASVRFQGDFVLLKFQGLDRLEDVQRLRGYDLMIRREDAIPLSDGEYFLGDFLGVKVLTDEGEEFGIVKEMLETGANPVFVVDHGGREVLIPKSPGCVLELKPEEGYIRVHLLEGLV